ncbi:hypothetical protein M8J77_009326 [Diaphorina citri]|nr:hypothetical protein M8J77_009326 [Diaphorina citri]
MQSWRHYLSHFRVRLLIKVMILIFFVNQIEGAWDPTFLDLVPSVTNPLLKSSNPFTAKTRVVGTGTRQQVVKYKNTSFSASI